MTEPSESREEDDSGHENQNLLTLIHACKSVDPHDTERKQTIRKELELEKEAKESSAAQTSPHLLLAEHIYQRCVTKVGSIGTGSSAVPFEQAGDDHFSNEDDSDSAALDMWRGIRSHNQDITLPPTVLDYGGSSLSMTSAEESLAFLDQHLPHWVTTAIPISSSSMTSPVSPKYGVNISHTGMGNSNGCALGSTMEGTVDGILTDIPSENSFLSSSNLTNNEKSMFPQKNMSISAALIEASTSSVISTTAKMKNSCSEKERTSIGIINTSIDNNYKTKKRSLINEGDGEKQGARTPCNVKRSKLEQQVEHCLGIIKRFHDRGDVMPRHQRSRKGQEENKQAYVKHSEAYDFTEDTATSPLSSKTSNILEIEHQDASKLRYWKQALSRDERNCKENHQSAPQSCPEVVRDLLDLHIPLWRDASLQKAHDIVERYRQRGGIMPREWRNRKNCPLREVEYQDANKLKHWKQAMRGVEGRACSSEVCEYLDKHMPGWRDSQRRSRIPTPARHPQDDADNCIVSSLDKNINRN